MNYENEHDRENSNFSTTNKKGLSTKNTNYSEQKANLYRVEVFSN